MNEDETKQEAAIPDDQNKESKTNLGDVIGSLANSLAALREFVSLVGSLLDDRRKKLIRRHRLDLIPVLLALNHHLEQPILSDEDAAMLTKRVSKTLKLDVSETGNVNFQFMDEAAAKKSLAAAQAFASSSLHQVLLYRSALMSLISFAEWFVSQIIRQHFELHNDAVGTRDKVLSLDDLKGFDSMQDARAYLIDMRIDELMRGSVDDWLKYLTEKVKLNAGYLDPHRDRLTEIFQRRNVMVHNNGLAHSSYINKVAPSLRAGIKSGHPMSVSPSYLNEAIDIIEVSFILLGAELWKHLDPDDDHRGSVLIDIAFERLTQQHWTTAEGLSLFLKNDKKLSERYRLIGTINYWQALKWQGKFDFVKEEVERADFTAKDDQYQLARFCLLDDLESFFELLPEVLKSGKLKGEQLETWPIFREIRKSKQYAEFVEKHSKEFELRKVSEDDEEETSMIGKA